MNTLCNELNSLSTNLTNSESNLTGTNDLQVMFPAQFPHNCYGSMTDDFHIVKCMCASVFLIIMNRPQVIEAKYDIFIFSDTNCRILE